MTGRGEGPDTVQATATSFEILKRLREGDSATLSQVADELGLAKSTAHRHLATLERLDLVARENGAYRIALRFLEFGEVARSGWPYYDEVCDAVDTLSTETKERVQFIVAEHGVGVCLYRSSGERAVDTSPAVGERMPLHAIAAGKVILAFDNDLDFRAFVEDGLEAPTGQTITDPEALYDELSTVRERRYAVNRDEHIPGLTAFGAPIRAPDEGVVGAISVSGPTDRLDEEQKERAITSQLLGITNELELNIAHEDDR